MSELIMKIKRKAEFIEDLCGICNEDFDIVDKELLSECLKKLTEVSETLEEYADI